MSEGNWRRASGISNRLNDTVLRKKIKLARLVL